MLARIPDVAECEWFCGFRLNPNNHNDARLVWGDVSGCVNVIIFGSATIALFERPSAPAGGKQGIDLQGSGTSLSLSLLQSVEQPMPLLKHQPAFAMPVSMNSVLSMTQLPQLDIIATDFDDEKKSSIHHYGTEASTLLHTMIFAHPCR